MKITKPFFDLFDQFNNNWSQSQSRYCLELNNMKISNLENHPLEGELRSLLNDQGGSLPFFSQGQIIWCTLAPDSHILKKTVEQLQAWILPSYGWVESNDGFKMADISGGAFQNAIHVVSPKNYFRWKCSINHLPIIEQKLSKRFQLEKIRPDRIRKGRPSLYELRSQFHAALTLGDKSRAEDVIYIIDTYELDKALNTQMMRIRMWHHFREFETIKNWRNLPVLKAHTSLPSFITKCINDVLGEGANKNNVSNKDVVKVQPEDTPREPLLKSLKETESDWRQWFELLEQEDIDCCQDWLINKGPINIDSLSQAQVKSYVDSWDTLFINDEFKKQYRHLINEALVTFLGDFVRELEFPRTQFDELYLSLLQLWGDLNSGKSIGREEGHVLLELANALFSLNYKVDEAKNIIEEWWKMRSVPSQLPFALDAIELLSLQHPDAEAAGNLWIDAADKARNNPQIILESEKILWRSIGIQLGFDEETIYDYFPKEQIGEQDDLLAGAKLNKVAIVCMREQQARFAAKEIHDRTGAEVVTVLKKVAGSETTQALTCDVVLFVWLATSHAVFRAFDGFDRQKLCYVQGTGGASIVRSLERWVVEQQN